MPHPCVPELLKTLPAHEGNIPYLYLDSNGNATCGMGHLVLTAEHSLTLPWLGAVPGRVERDFATVKALPPNKVPSYYMSHSICRLPLGWGVQDAATRLETIYLPQIQNLFKNFDTFPLQAQTALLDMTYNMGIGHPSTGTTKATGLCNFTHLIAACSNGDWTTAAAQCHRAPPVSQERNDWTRGMFLAAVAGGNKSN